jgi:uncharacterized protein (DUF983 family)
MKRILLSLVIFTGLVGQSAAGEFLDLAYGILALRAATPAPVIPTPTPSPTSDTCPECNGKGKLGDGTVFVTCPECDGTGKKKKPGDAPAVITPDVPEVTPQPEERVHYPIRSRWWSGCGSWRHLTVGQHAGLFDSAWLASLTHEEVQSLHSDHHEGRTKWEYVVRPQPAAKPVDKSAPQPTASRSNCPGGNCPTSSGRLFSRFLGR